MTQYYHPVRTIQILAICQFEIWFEYPNMAHAESSREVVLHLFLLFVFRKEKKLLVVFLLACIIIEELPLDHSRRVSCCRARVGLAATGRRLMPAGWCSLAQ